MHNPLISQKPITGRGSERVVVKVVQAGEWLVLVLVLEVTRRFEDEDEDEPERRAPRLITSPRMRSLSARLISCGSCPKDGAMMFVMNHKFESAFQSRASRKAAKMQRSHALREELRVSFQRVPMLRGSASARKTCV